jgi:hypothetical protein
VNLELISYLIQNCAESIEFKSVDGYTPLALAFSKLQVEAAKLLILAGANQAVRDYKGNNLVHLVLSAIGNGNDESNVDDAFKLLKLIDTRLIPSMLLERSSADPGSLSPLARWLHTNFTVNNLYHRNPRRLDNRQESEGKVNFVIKFLNFTSIAAPEQEQLELLDGAGNTPVHAAVSFQCHEILKTMLQHRPDLLFRENAVGRTPAELAEDLWIAEVTNAPPFVATSKEGPRYNHDEDEDGKRRNVIDRQLDWYKQTNEQRSDNRTERRKIWEFCQSLLVETENQQDPGSLKRRLVTLAEANGVAERLANRKTQDPKWARGRYMRRRGNEDQEMMDGLRDEISVWFGSR